MFKPKRGRLIAFAGAALSAALVGPGVASAAAQPSLGATNVTVASTVFLGSGSSFRLATAIVNAKNDAKRRATAAGFDPAQCTFGLPIVDQAGVFFVDIELVC
jgi:hypothetical protein